jgi:hypothetical protein
MNDPATVARVLAPGRAFDPRRCWRWQPTRPSRTPQGRHAGAVDRGIFGAPTFFVGDEMFWGQDRLDFVREALLSIDSPDPTFPTPEDPTMTDILTHTEAGVMTLTFNRVDKKNSITPPCTPRMADALEQLLRRTPAVRVVVLQGTPPSSAPATTSATF